MRTGIDTTITCWVIYLDHPTGDGPETLTPAAVAATEEDAHAILEQALTATPERGNQLEDYPLQTDSDGNLATGMVHLVARSDDEGGPTVSAVFDTLTAATHHAEALRQHGEENVTITCLTVNELPAGSD